MGFTECTPIQKKSLPFSLEGLDVLGKAQTGTGKTAAFLVALFNDLLNQPTPQERYAGEPRALVVAPTRELVMQIAQDAADIGKHTGLSMQTVVGGIDYDKQLQKLRAEHVDVLVATPGRLLDYCQKRELFLDQLEVLVIDEADRMLDMGFIPQVKHIVRLSPKNEYRMTLLFSATFSDDVLRLSERWMHDPVTIEVEPETITTKQVDQKVYYVSESDKLATLDKIIQREEVESLIVFANRRDQCRDLTAALKKRGFKVGLLSGEVAQAKRIKTLEQFKDGHINVLVATDVAGRGIHIDGITHVVNYTLPEDAEDYVHRIGRTGRAGKKGVSISFASEDDSFVLPEIEKLINMKIPHHVI